MNNAAVENNMYRMKLSDDPNCTCGKGRQTVEHVILHCENFISERLLLKTRIGTIWLNSKKSGNIQFDLKLLFNPNSNKLNKKEASEVAKEFENFLRNIDFVF